MADQPSYDVVVLGAGPGGYVAAIRAAQLGLKTAIVEKEFLGGVCLNIGCIPSKALIRNASIVELLHRGKDFGFSVDNIQVDYSAAVKRSRQVSDRLTKGVGFLMRKNKIDVLMGTGTLTSANSLRVVTNDGNEQTLQAKNFIIATGARPRGIPGVETDGQKVVTYREAILQESRPESVVIVGSGPIGLEFGYVWKSYGSNVTIVEMLDALAPLEDEEISAELAKSYSRAGFNVKLSAKVTGVDASGDKVKVKVQTNDGEETLEGDQTLVAIGFRPNSENIGLETVGVAVERGVIAVDDYQRTNVPNIYAIGDVTGKLMLAHVGSAQGIVAAETIADHPTVPLDYLNMPRCTYCHPEIASFGLTEKQAKEQGYEYTVGKFPFQANGRALGMGDSTGFVKLLKDNKYGEILGAHLIGPEVTELLPELTLARLMELTPEEISRNVHAHPTLSETLGEVAHASLGAPIHI